MVEKNGADDVLWCSFTGGIMISSEVRYPSFVSSWSRNGGGLPSPESSRCSSDLALLLLMLDISTYEHQLPLKRM